MANPNDIRTLVDSFVSELTTLVRTSALEAVQGALGGSAPKRRGPGRPRGAAPVARKGKRVKRDPAAVLAVADKVHAAIKAKPGQSVEQIGKGLGMKTKDLALPIKKLVEAKKVRTKGQRRGTRYFAG
ncbi:MAG: DNA-binding protein [Planctomycetota bacterium]|nr:MAG: DNA-binding protein [Planctomycetota bacterium]